MGDRCKLPSKIYDKAEAEFDAFLFLIFLH